MKSIFRLVGLLALFSLSLSRVSAVEAAITSVNGLYLGTATTDRVSLYGATPASQPTASSQAALTDSTTGTAGTTLAAGVGVTTVTIPLSSLATGLSTSALDIMTAYTPGYKFKILAIDFVTTIAGTGTSASQAFNLTIGSTATTGGVCTVTLTGTNTVGKLTNGTSITALNTGTASDTVSLKMAASGTVFTAGAGFFVVKIQNMDTADAVASLANLANATRSAAVTVGVMKGS